jgi:hypothetical protein
MLLPALYRGTLPDVPSPVVYATPPSTINNAIALADKEAQQLDCWAFLVGIGAIVHLLFDL